MTDTPDLAHDLLALVDALLGEQGVLAATPGLAFNPLQLDYAQRAALGFLRQDRARARTAINAVQASTGTGKTYGYLVPVMGYAALTGERVVISTFTRHLQRQVLDSAVVVSEWVRARTGVALTVARRLGMSNFLSSSAISDLLDALDDQGEAVVSERRQLLEDMQAWVRARDGDALVHSGLLEDFLADHGLEALPADVPVSAVTLSSSAPEADREAYARHVQASKSADVVVVNHALLVSNVMRWGSLLAGDGRVIGAVVCDEADRLRDAAESLLQADYTFVHACANAVQVARALKVPLLDMSAQELLDDMRALGREAGSEGMVLNPRDALCHEVCGRLHGYLATATPTALGLARTISQDGLLPAGVRREVAVEFIDLTRRLGQALDQLRTGQGMALLSWSPVKAWPSLRMGQAYPGRILSRLWAPLEDRDDPLRPPATLIQSILFTSATLGVPGRGLPEAFDDFFSDIGVVRHPKRGEALPIHHVQIDLFARLEPLRFGRLDFVVMDPRIPDPTDRDTLETNPVWLDACAAMIAQASSAGGRTLVLATSFQDANALGQVLARAGRSALVHARGVGLAGLISQFKADPQAIMISPSAWEGMDLPGMIAQLVITRVPFGSLDSMDMQLLRLGLLQSGLAEDKVRGILMGRLTAAAKQRLMQGLGRPIRSADDRATVWFADPRLPLPAGMADSLHPAVLEAPIRPQFAPLLQAIPARFRHEAYHRAPMFCPAGIDGKPAVIIID